MAAKPGAADASRVLVTAWARFQPRTHALGPALGGESFHIDGRWPGRQLALLPLRYLANAIRTWRLLRRRRPTVLVAVTPPVVAPAVAWLWCRTHRCALVVDCHTAGFHWGKWRWTVPIHRVLFRRASAVLLHTEEDAAMVRGWGFPAVVLPDDLPGPGEAAVRPPSTTARRILVAGSFDNDEPVAAALAAAALLPQAEVRFTGNVRRLPAGVAEMAPPNVSFTGFLAYRDFLGELLAADVVAVFSTDETAMNRAAFEAIGLSRPLVLSDVAGLRARFQAAAIFCRNDEASMAQTLRRALADQPTLADRSRALRDTLQAQRDEALWQLQSMLETQDPAPVPATAARSLP
jgi:glycosyltransferase involved in cell wall biosynthesis